MALNAFIAVHSFPSLLVTQPHKADVQLVTGNTPISILTTPYSLLNTFSPIFTASIPLL